MQIIFTKDEKWLNKWDDFVLQTPKGSHLILSSWLQSFEAYGFNYELGIVLENNKIIGGFGAVIPKIVAFKFYIIPHGPIFIKDCESELNICLHKIKERAKALKCCYVQVSLPISSHKKINNYVYHPNHANTLEPLYKKGKLFNYVYCSYGLNWVDLSKYSNSDEFLQELTPKVRRNVRMPYNKNVEATLENSSQEIEKGYDVIVDNAKQGHYSVRDFNEFRPTIISLIEKQNAYFVNCRVDNKIKASAFFIKSGGYITNITGGVLREKPDIKLGYMLQWEMIKKSFQLGCKGYNISMGGSDGVQDFKSKFGAETIFYDEPHYHIILKPLLFKMFLVLDKYIKPYKAQISSVLTKFKK